MYKKYVSTEKEKHAITITNLYDPNIDYYKERENRMSSLKIDLGKGVSLSGGSINYDEKIGPIHIQTKHPIKGKPTSKVGSKFNIGKATVDIGIKKHGKQISGGGTIKIPFKKGGQI